MSRKLSPFAELTGAEKQIRWLEYQSIRLPYQETDIDLCQKQVSQINIEKNENQHSQQAEAKQPELPQPPPEVPRIYPEHYQKSQHSQYDAVIARLKQAELQSRRHTAQTFQ